MNLHWRFLLITSGLILSLVASWADAAPGFSGCLAVHNSQINDLQNLIHPVSVIYQRDEHGKIKKEDTRQMLKDLKGAHVNEAFKRRVRINMGFVYCRSDDPNNKLHSASGSLYGDGMQLMTAIHVIQDSNGKTMPQCWFRNRENPSQKVELDLSSAGMHPFTNQDINIDYSHDLVAIRLKQPIKGANPFPFDPSPTHNGEQLVMISAYHDDSPARLSITEPIAQFCQPQNVFARTVDTEPLIDSDCTTKGGASGGALLAYRNGAWANVGMNLGGGLADKDFQEYDYSNNVFTQAIGYDEQNLKELNRFAAERQSASN